MILIKQNEATASKRAIFLFLVDSTGLNPYTGGAGGTCKILYPGAGTFINSATLVALTSGTGHYSATLPTANLGTLGIARLVFPYNSGTSLEAYADIQIISFDPYDGSALGLARIDTLISSRSSHSTVDIWAYATRAITDKAGFGLAADQSAVTVGTLNTYLGTVGTLVTYLGTIGTVGTVLVYNGTVGTVGTIKVNADKSGYGLSADQSAVTIGTLNTYLGTIGTLLTYLGTIGTVGSLKTNLDKTGYGLANDQSAVTIGTVNTVPAIGSVGTVGTLGSQAQADIWAYATRALTDKAGFSLAANQSAVTIGTVNTVPAIGSVGTVGTVLDKAGYSLAANQSAVTIGTVNTVPSISSVGTVGTVLDKSGYSLAADQSAVTIGTVNTVPAIGSVGTVGTVLDKSGYSLAANQSAVTIGTLNTYLGTVGTVGTIKTNADKAGYSLATDQSSVRIGTVDIVGTLGTQAKADINAEVVDVMRVDTLVELAAGAPTAQPPLDRAIMFIYMDERNKITQTGSLRTIYNDAGTAVTKSTLSDDGTTFTKEEYIAP